jgi:hypothetical protein
VAANSLRLDYDELEALRKLQAGAYAHDVHDLIWNELEELQLVERRDVRFPYWSLTMRDHTAAGAGPRAGGARIPP